METLVWLVLLLAVPIALAYRRSDLRTATAALGALLLVYTFVGDGGFLWKLILWILFAGLALLNVEHLRRDLITRRIIAVKLRGSRPLAFSRAISAFVFAGLPTTRIFTRRSATASSALP